MPADVRTQALDLERATRRLLETAERLHPARLGEASLLPGWTRGHVLTHLARNADGTRNLLSWARTGRPTPMYASAEARAEDIETGARRPPAEVLADVQESAERLASDIVRLPHEAWAREVRFIDGTAFPAAALLWNRIKEVEIHHLDLAAGRTPDDWSNEFAQQALTEVVGSLGQRDDALTVHLIDSATGIHRFVVQPTPESPRVHGTAGHLLAWLIGRGGVAEVRAGDGPLPVPPTWS